MTMLSRLKRDLTMADVARAPGGARVDLVLVSEMVAPGAKVLDIGAGEGDLLLRVPVKGLRFAGETAQGVHFADASGLGVRYSHAAWTDAASSCRAKA